MKKILLILMVASIWLTACSQTKNETKDNTETKSEAKSNIKIEHLTNSTFKAKVFDYEKNEEWKYKGELPAIIDFYADWCRPCKMVAPTLEQIQKDYDGKLIVYKVDVQHEKELASVFQTSSIPAFLFIPAKGKPQMAKGLLPRESFDEIINDFLKVNL